MGAWADDDGGTGPSGSTALGVTLGAHPQQHERRQRRGPNKRRIRRPRQIASARRTQRGSQLCACSEAHAEGLLREFPQRSGGGLVRGPCRGSGRLAIDAVPAHEWSRGEEAANTGRERFGFRTERRALRAHALWPPTAAWLPVRQPRRTCTWARRAFVAVGRSPAELRWLWLVPSTAVGSPPALACACACERALARTRACVRSRLSARACARAHVCSFNCECVRARVRQRAASMEGLGFRLR